VICKAVGDCTKVYQPQGVRMDLVPPKKCWIAAICYGRSLMKDRKIIGKCIGIRLQEKVEKGFWKQAFLSSYFQSVENGRKLISENKFITLFQRSTNTKNFIPEIEGLGLLPFINCGDIFPLSPFLLLKKLEDTVSMDVHELELTSLKRGGWWLVRMESRSKGFFGNKAGFILSIPFFKVSLVLMGVKSNLKEYFIRR